MWRPNVTLGSIMNLVGTWLKIWLRRDYLSNFIDGDISRWCRVPAIRQPDKEILRANASDINPLASVAVHTPDVAENPQVVFALYPADLVSEPFKPVIQAQSKVEAATS